MVPRAARESRERALDVPLLEDAATRLHHEDLCLARACLANCEGAWELMEALLRGATKHWERAARALSEVSEQARRRPEECLLARYAGCESLMPRVLRLANRRERDWRRSDKRERKRGARRQTPPSAPESPLDRLIERESAEVLALNLIEAVRALRASSRELLLRRYGSDETVRRIASRVRLRIATVKKRLRRTTLALRFDLRRHAAEFADLSASGLERLLEVVADALAAESTTNAETAADARASEPPA
jgi:hypothetical protein